MRKGMLLLSALLGALYVGAADIKSAAYLWIDASRTDTMTFSGSEITEWCSVNGGAKAAKYTLTGQYASVTPSGPTIADGLVSFGSTTANRDLCFPKSTNIRAVFMVAKVEQGGNAFLLGDDEQFHFHRGGSGEYWHAGHSSENIRNGKTYFNGVEVTNPTGTTMPNRLALIDVQTAGSVTASQLCYDRQGNGATPRRGGKDIAELLVFTNELTVAQQQEVRDYLMTKWGVWEQGDAKVVRAHPRLTLGLGKESLIGVKLTEGQSGALTNLTVRFDLTNCTPEQVRDVRVWRQKYDPVPFTFFERDAIDLTEKGLSGKRGAEVVAPYHGALTVDFVATNVTSDLTIYPKSGSMAEGDYIWVTAKIDESIATNAEIWASIAGDRVRLTSGDFKLSNSQAKAPHRPFPYKYQIGAYVRQDRLVDNGQTTWDIFSGNPKERFETLTDVLPIYSAKDGYSGGKFYISNWDKNLNDTASTARLVKLRDQYNPGCMIRPSLTPSTWVSANGIYGLAFEVAGAAESTRKQFAEEIVAFLVKQNCDGLDVDYEWVRDGTNHREWQNIGKMLRELSEQFFDHGFVLSFAGRSHDSAQSGMPYSTEDYGAFNVSDYMMMQSYGGGYLNSAPCIQKRTLDVCTKRLLPLRRVVMGQAAYVSADGHPGWDGASYKIEAMTSDPLRRFDIDTWWKVPYSSYWPFEGMSSLQAQCLWARRKELGGVMSWGYYTDPTWDGWSSFGRHQSKAIWPMPNCWQEPAVEVEKVGGGGEEKWYVLRTEEDWFWLAEHPNVKAKLANDITLEHDPLVIDMWTGELDGDGHKLIFVQDTWVASEKATGLIRTLKGTVKNLTVEMNGRVFTVAARWNDQTANPADTRLVNTMQGENSVGVIAAEAGDGAVVENVTVTMGAGSEVKGVKYAGGLVGKVSGAATITNNTVKVEGKLHLEVRNIWDTLFQPSSPVIDGAVGYVGGQGTGRPTITNNTVVVLPGGEIQDLDYIPEPQYEISGDWCNPTGFDWALPWDLDVRSSDYAVEVVMELPNYTEGKIPAGHYPQLVNLTGAGKSVSLSASGDGGGELFLTGSGSTASYAHPISRGAIRGNGDVGSGVKLGVDDGRRCRIVIENRGGELRIIQNGETVLVTDKNVASDGYVRSVQIGAGLSQLGDGGRIVSVRLKLGRKGPLVHPEGYGKLVFDEEFDGDTIDWEHNWEKVPIMWSGAPDWRKYTSHREDLTVVSNGCLVLTGAKNAGSVPGDTRKYQCGQIQSNRKFSFKYGVVEIRAKFTDQDGAWPAIWMMPQNAVHGGWPRSGEIDISERLNADKYTYQTAHFGETDTTSGATGPIDKDNFNVFRLEWTENAITWYINGVKTHSYANPGGDWRTWPFDSDFYFILSQQLEGSWVGTVDDETTLPNRMFIDYVRVWQKDEDNIQTNAYLWLDATRGVKVEGEGEVVEWTSDNIFGRVAKKYTLASESPSGPTNANGLVSFGDTSANRDLAFDRATDLRTVFMVAKTEQSGNAFLLGDSSAYNLHRGERGEYWSGNASESVRNGKTFWNGELVTNATEALMPSKLGLVELHAADAFTASQICYDRVGNGSANPRRGGKDVAELVVFKDALNYTERLKLRKALTEKWNLAHPNWSITEDWVLRRENDFSDGITVDRAFADGAGTYEFKNIKLTGGLQSASYKLRVREGDTIVIDGTDNGNGRCRFAFEMLGGDVTFPEGLTTWYENPAFVQKGGTFTSLANGQEQVDTSSGFMLGYNGVTMTLDISGGLFMVPNSSINFFDPVTMNIGGSLGSLGGLGGIVRAKGLFRSSLNSATVNVTEGGRLEIGSLGIKANTCALNLKGGTLAAFEDGAAVHNAINVVSDSTLEVPAGMVLSIDGAISGAGALSLAGEGSLKLTVTVTPEEVQSGTIRAVMHVAEDFPLARCELYFDCPEYFAKPKKTDAYAIMDGVLYLKPSMPDLRADAYLWLDAALPETLVTNAQGQVTEWKGALGEGTLSATNYTLSSQSPSGPTLIDAGRPGVAPYLVSFGSTSANRDLCFQKSENIRTVFMVARIQQSPNAFVLGDREAYHFHRGAASQYWESGHSSENIRNGKTYWNGALVNNPTGTTIPNALGLITIETTGGVTASQLCYDRTGNGSTPRRGGKDIAELLIFEKTLTADERRSIENYLIAKWHLGDVQTVMVEGSPAIYSPSTSNLNLSVYGAAPTTNGTFAIVNAMVGAADVTLAEVPDVPKLDLILTMKTSLTIPGGGKAAFTIPSGSSVTIGEGGYPGAITATDETSALSFTGEEPIDWPFAAEGTVFPGLVTLACPIANSGRQYLYGDKSVVFDAGSSMTLDALNLGNEGDVTQNLTIRGGDITVTGAIEPLATTGSVIIAHWPSRVNFTLEDGAFTALNAATMLGWDGHANLTISGGKMYVSGLWANRASSHDNTSSVILSGGELSLGADGIDFTGRGDRNASFALAGGTLSCREDAAVAIAQEDGLYAYAPSTLAAASNATLTVLAPLTGAGDLSLDAPYGTISFADISGWTGSFVAVTDNTHLRITVARSSEEIAARKPVTVAQLPENVTAEQCTVKFYNTDTGGEVASTVTLEGGKLVATPEMTDRQLTYTPTEEVGTFVWDDTEGAFDGETFQDFDSVAFQRVVSTNGLDYATSVTLPEGTWASRVDVGGTLSFSGETLYANAIAVSNAHFAAESLVAGSIAFGPDSTIRLDGTWRAVEGLDIPFDATLKAVDGGVLALTGATNRFADGVTFDFSEYAVHTSGRHYIVTGEASDWPTSTAFRVVGGLPLYKDDAGYFTETIVTVTVTNGEELVIGEDIYDNLNVQSGGTLAYRGTTMSITDSVTFDADAIVTLFEADGSKIPYVSGTTRDVVKAKTITGIPKSTQDFTFEVVDNGDGTKTLRAKRNIGSARVVRAHPLLTRGVGRESLAAIDFSGNYGGNMPSVTFRIRFENMTADDLGDIKLYRMPYGTPYAFYAPSAQDLSSNFTVSRVVSEDKRVLTLTYTPTGSGVWIYPELSGMRDNSDRIWLTGELQNLKTLPDNAHFYVDVTTDRLLLGSSDYKVENGIAAAPHRLYPWRYLVTAYMRRDRINGNTIGTLENAPEMRWPSLTHVIIASFDVQYSWGSDTMGLSWDDNAEGAFRRLKEYRDRYHPECHLVPSLAKGNKISLDSRGAGEESRYAIAHASEKKYRAQFVKALVAKMQEMGADGLDIDWEYPDDNGGLDYNAYGLLMRDLAEAFFDHGWDLSMCSNLGWRMPGGEVMAAADYMSSMAYDHETIERYRGLHSPNTTMSDAIVVLTSRNVPRRRIVVGHAMYSTAKYHMGWDELAGRCGNDDDIINEKWTYNGASGEFIGFTGPTTYRAKANRVQGVYSDGYEYGGIMSWGYYTDTNWWGGKSLGWNQRQTIWPRPYNFPTPTQDEDGTYVLTNETDWCWFAENAASVQKARLAADITFDHDPKPIPAFSGVLDGANHKLTIPSGVWVVAFEKVGLFQTLTGTIRNLRLDVAGRFIGRNDRRNDVQTSGWKLSAHGGDGVSAAVLVAEANAGAHIENVYVLMRKGSELRGNHEVGVLAGQVWSSGASVVIRDCTVECFGTVSAKAVDSVNALITSGATGNGRVGLLVGSLNFSDASEGVTLQNCSATLRAGAELSSVCGNYRTLGGLVGNLHVGAGNAKFIWSGLSMTCYEGATVSGLKDNGNTPYCCQPFFGYTFGTSSSTKPSLGTANALTFAGVRLSGFDSSYWLDGSYSHMGITESGEAPKTLTTAETIALDNLGTVTLSALLDLPANKSGDVILAQCTGGYQLWANVTPVSGRPLLSLTLGYTSDGTRTSCGEVARLVPGVHEVALGMVPNKEYGATLYADGNALVTRKEYCFSSNPFTGASFGYDGVGLYAYDVFKGARGNVRYPKKATYEAVNLITFGKDDDSLMIRDITYPTALASATLKAAINTPENVSAGPIADWKVSKDSAKYVVEAYRESADSTRIKWRNEGNATRNEAEQTANRLDNTGTKTLNFIHRNDDNGTTVSLNAKTAVDSQKTKWGGSTITGAAIGLKAGMSVAMREWLLGTVQKPDSKHPLDGLAEEPEWYPSASSCEQDYFRDIVVETLGTYEPPAVTINGKEVTGGESAKVIYLYAGDREKSADYDLTLGAPELKDGNVTLSFAGTQPVNAALQLLESTGLTNAWSVAAELPPSTSERTFVLKQSGDSDFYFACASETATPAAAQGMPIVSSTPTQAYMGTVEVEGGRWKVEGDGFEVQLEGAGVAEGMTGYLVADGTAYVSHVDADGKLVFETGRSGIAPYQLYLVVPAGATNGNIRVTSPAVSAITYPDALVTEVVADNLYKDGFTTHDFGSYRIPALVTDGKGEVLCCYDVRFGGGDLGTGDGIDIGETYSADFGDTFAKPRLAVDVLNKRERDGSQRSGWNKNWDIGDVALLYDDATATYWMMGMTGTGLYQGNYSMNDVVMYTRGKGPNAAWSPWRNPQSNSTDPLEYRSIKETIMSQPGIKNASGGKGYGFLEGPGHGFVTSKDVVYTNDSVECTMPKGTLVFPTQYFVDSSLVKSTVGAVYSKDHGTNWIATARSTAGTNPQENCVMELDDGSWYMTTKAGSRPGTGRINFFRTTNYKNWNYVGEYNPVPCQQGSCLRLGTNKTDGKGRYVLCHTLHPDTATRARVALVFGTDTTGDVGGGGAGISWDFSNPLMLYYDNTGFKGYNSLCMVDDHTLGVLYEAQGHIYFIRIDVSDRLGRAAATIKM